MEIEVSAFGNFSTDTGSNQVNINVFRFRRSRPPVPHGANFLGRLRRIDLIISIWGSNVRPSVRMSVRTSVRPKKVFSIPMKFGM